MNNTTSMVNVALSVTAFFVSTVFLSLLSATVIQGLEALGLRAFLNRRFVHAWLESRASELNHEGGLGPAAEKMSRTFESDRSRSSLPSDALAEVSVASATRGLFDLPHDQLCGQISLIANDAADRTPPSALAQILTAPGRGTQAPPIDSSNQAREALAKDSSNVPGPLDSSNQDREAPAADSTRAIERSIDGLQITLAANWRTVDYVASFLVAYGLSFLLIAWDVREQTVSLPIPHVLLMVVALSTALTTPVVRPMIDRWTWTGH